MAYINEGDIENFIIQDIDNSFSSFISTIIAWVEEYIDNYCGTNYRTTAASGVKYYDGTGLDRITIDPFTSISSIEILDANGNVQQSLNASDYYLYPYNDSSYSSIVLSAGGSIGSFPDRVRSIKVTGTFGLSAAVPEPIKMVAVKLSAKLINEGLKGGQVSSESLGSYSVDYKDLDESADSLGVKEVLNQYRVMEL